uniref:Katanin p80 WD40 repeat-containing subunit B1 n=1 Tax=Catharus ustulatus TaxID=91951 RepID=A0A8C3Y696_CATUS
AACPVETEKCFWRKNIMAHSSNVSSVVLGKGSGRMLATGGDDCRVNIWSVSKPNCIMSLTGHTSPIESLQVNPNEKLIVAGSRSGSIRVWDLEAAKVLRSLPGHKANICSLHFHPFGSFVASGSLDTNIKLWDVRRKGCIFTFKGHKEAVRCLRFSPDGKWVASAADDHTVKLWDLTAGKLMFEFTGHTGPVNVVEFHPNEYLLASGSSDRTVRFWDLEKFQVVSCIEEEATPVRCVLFSPDGCCLYSGFQDSLRVYGWEPERCFDVVVVNWGKVADLSISNNQLIGVSFAQSTVSSFVVDLSRVPKSDSIPHGLIRDDQPLVPPTPTGSSLRRIYDRPSTSCSKSQSRVKHNSESERHSPSSEDDRDEKESRAEIQNQEDYKEIFQPKNAICRTPPRNEPFPAPPEDGEFGNDPLVGWAVKNQSQTELVDEEAMSQIRKGHETMCVVLTSRHKNLDAVRAVWSTSDIKNSLDSAVAINDLSVVVDLLNIVNQKASLWKLDLCTIVLPQIEKLLQSKYESYVQTGCTSLKLILQRFLPLITDILAAPPSVGVDISREERLQKCKLCYKQLKNISNVVKNKSGLSGRHGSAFRELLLLMAVLD